MKNWYTCQQVYTSKLKQQSRKHESEASQGVIGSDCNVRQVKNKYDNKKAHQYPNLDLVTQTEDTKALSN